MRNDPIRALPDQPTVKGGHHQPYSAYNQGWDAAEAGYPRSLNPYQVDPEDRSTVRNRQWWFGGYDGAGTGPGQGDATRAS